MSGILGPDALSPRTVMLSIGTTTVQLHPAAAAEPKKLVIVPGANHTDLYDKVDVIPFDKFTEFFERNL